MHPRLQNKANWTYCIKSKAALIKLYPNDLKQKTSHNQAFMPDCDWSLFVPLEAVHLSFLQSLSERFLGGHLFTRSSLLFQDFRFFWYR
jgi:hypothetical protein